MFDMIVTKIWYTEFTMYMNWKYIKMNLLTERYLVHSPLYIIKCVLKYQNARKKEFRHTLRTPRKLISLYTVMSWAVRTKGTELPMKIWAVLFCILRRTYPVMSNENLIAFNWILKSLLMWNGNTFQLFWNKTKQKKRKTGKWRKLKTWLSPYRKERNWVLLCDINLHGPELYITTIRKCIENEVMCPTLSASQMEYTSLISSIISIQPPGTIFPTFKYKQAHWCLERFPCSYIACFQQTSLTLCKENPKRVGADFYRVFGNLNNLCDPFLTSSVFSIVAAVFLQIVSILSLQYCFASKATLSKWMKLVTTHYRICRMKINNYN